MRVLHVSDRLTDRGGAYQYLLALIARQSGEHDVSLAVGRHDDADAGCDVLVVPGLEARGREPVALEGLVAELGPDVIHVHTVVNPDALEQAGQYDAAARVITVQDHRYFCPGKGKWTEDGDVCSERMSKELCTQCFTDDVYYDAIMTLTEERLAALARFRVLVFSEYMKRELGLDQAVVLPPFVHGLDATLEPGDYDGPPCVLFAGRLVEAKGARDAVEVWKRSGVELPLVFAGTGTLRDELAAIEGCEVLGWVPHERMASVYRRAVAVLMPSRWQEPFGIVGLEACALGIPVVAWESGGISEWHPGPLARWGDIDALAARLRVVVAEPFTDAPRLPTPEEHVARLNVLYGNR